MTAASSDGRPGLEVARRGRAGGPGPRGAPLPPWRWQTCGTRCRRCLRSRRGQRVEDQVRARQVAERLRPMAPLHDAVRPDDDERPCRASARREPCAERARRLALRLEVRQLLDRDAELLAERGLRVRVVAGDAVERRAAPGELLADLVVDLELVGA